MLTMRVLVRGLARIPLKFRIPVVIILAGATIVSGCSQDSGAASAVHAACNGFRQWQRSHNTSTLNSAANNLDHWVGAYNNYRRPDSAVYKAITVDDDIDQLLLGVQKVFPDENVPADTRRVASDCKGN